MHMSHSIQAGKAILLHVNPDTLFILYFDMSHVRHFDMTQCVSLFKRGLTYCCEPELAAQVAIGLQASYRSGPRRADYTARCRATADAPR